MVYDPLSSKLPASAPVGLPGLLEVVGRYEHLGILELQAEFAACEERFKTWVRDPENAGRPIAEAPDYLDRIALDSLLERRTWWE